MLSLRFNEFSDLNQYEAATGQSRRFPGDDYELYVLRDGSRILYVGISRSGIWNRWFGSLGRMCKTYLGEWAARDNVGLEIISHFPDSLNYIIDLYTFEEARDFCRDEIENTQLRLKRLGGDIRWAEPKDIRSVEPLMIRKLKPALNVTHNNDYGEAEIEIKNVHSDAQTPGRIG